MVVRAAAFNVILVEETVTRLKEVTQMPGLVVLEALDEIENPHIFN
jgi:hypothetical protein